MCDRSHCFNWPIVHLADAAKNEAVCGREPPAALMTIRCEAVTCPECLLIDNAHRARVLAYASPA
jgi:hypothetical protein